MPETWTVKQCSAQVFDRQTKVVRQCRNLTRETETLCDWHKKHAPMEVK